MKNSKNKNLTSLKFISFLSATTFLFLTPSNSSNPSCKGLYKDLGKSGILFSPDNFTLLPSRSIINNVISPISILFSLKKFLLNFLFTPKIYGEILSNTS